MIATKKSSGRGRPRSFEPEAAIAIAQDLFHKRGYDGLGVAEIVDAMGIRPPSFYAAFGSKAGLFARVLERYEATIGGWAQAALECVDDPAEGMRRLFARAADVYADPEGRTGCLVMNNVADSSDLEAQGHARAIKAQARAFYADYFRRTHPDQAEALAGSVMMGLSGMSAAAREGAGREELARFGAVLAAGFAEILNPSS